MAVATGLGTEPDVSAQTRTPATTASVQRVAEEAPAPLWSPPPERAAGSAMARFMAKAGQAAGTGFDDYEQLWLWSVEHPERFWPLLAEFFGVSTTGRGPQYASAQISRVQAGFRTCR